MTSDSRHTSVEGQLPTATKPLPRSSTMRRWLGIGIVVVVGIGAWQWRCAMRSDTVRRLQVATERLMDLAGRCQAARAGGLRVAEAFAGGALGEWQWLAVSARDAGAPLAKDVDGEAVFDACTAAVFADIERDLRAAAEQLAVSDCDLRKAFARLDAADALLPAIARHEQRLVQYLSSPTWRAAAAVNSDPEFALDLRAAAVPYLAQARTALFAGDDDQVAAAFARLRRLFAEDRVTAWRELKQVTESLAASLDKAMAPPAGRTSLGPASWLRREAADVEAQFEDAEAKADVPRWQRALAIAKSLLALASKADQLCSEADRQLKSAEGMLPLAFGRQHRDHLLGFQSSWWECDLSAAEAWLKTIEANSSASRLRNAGLVAVTGAATDEATGLPTQVVHAVTGARLVLVEAGQFMMGSPTNENLRNGDQALHRCEIRRPFYLGVTEVTQAQWRKVMGSNPSEFQGDDLPVEKVSWEDCQQFLQKAGGGLRLPSEAEWEYACRAGTTTPFSFGATITPEQVNYNGNYPYGGASEGLYRARTVAVGSLPANAWGLHEMHGNVWEWCQDGYEAYPSSGTAEPARAAGARVLRGGSWFSGALYCRAAYRLRYEPGGRNYDFGLRLARTLPQ